MLAAEDRAAILELLPRYAAAIDGRRPDDLRALFTPEATFTSYGAIGGRRVSAEGRDAIVDRIRDRLSSTSHTQRRHVMANQFVVPDGSDAATVHAYLLLCTTTDGALAVLATGRYASGVVRTPDGWRLHDHVLHLDAAVS